MTAEPGQLAAIIRHPIKAHGREFLASVQLSEDACLPWDRAWAVTHERSRFDPAEPRWTPCGHFQRGARSQSLMAIESQWNPEAGRMTLRHPNLAPLHFDPETEGPRLIDWLAPISPAADFRPKALVRVPGVAMTDSDFPSISIQNLASNAALAQHLGQDLSIHRWRGNLWLQGFAPWAERDWLGRSLRIGAALLQVVEPIGRCKATTGNPETGLSDADTLGGLRALLGAQEFGLYARVIEPGAIALGDTVEVI